MNLSPCPYRHVGDEGHILCDKIKTGDREVKPNICRACPISQINCGHLRAKLAHQAHPPVTVRWGNGRTEVWEDNAPFISFDQAACAEKVIPIHSPKDCANCPLRQPLIAVQAIAQSPAVERRVSSPRARAVQRSEPIASQVAPAPMTVQPTPIVSPAQPSAEARSSIVAQKIIQLQEWLAKQKNAPHSDNDNEVRPIVVTARPAPRVAGEEKRVGWTD
jgi:hypothetical protein